MQVVLLPCSSSNIRGEDVRFEPLRGLLLKLAEAGEFVQVFAYLPPNSIEEQSDLLRFLVETQRYGCSTSLIVQSPLLKDGILDHPYLPAIEQLIVAIDAQASIGDDQVRVLQDYAQRTAEHPQQLLVWMDGHVNGKGSLREILRVGRAVPNLSIPEFRLGGASATGASATDASATAPVAEDVDTSIAEFPGCKLFENALTVDADGRILPCPRYADAGERPDLGSLCHDSTESLLIKKGQLLPGLGLLPACQSCPLSARWFWPESRSDYSAQLMLAGAQGIEPEQGSLDWTLAMRQNISALTDADFARILQELEQRLQQWADGESPAVAEGLPLVSIETPVIKAGWLLPCIESVLSQSSPRWQFSLLWDHGDDRSRQILEVVQQFGHPRLQVYFGDGVGVARARRFLTERSDAAYILPLDDDDLLKPEAVEQFLRAAEATPWSGIIRARRDFVDEFGLPVDMEDWFPFEPRQYHHGMTRDLYNHSQPYLITRAAYNQTAGWEGFEEYRFAGEDCDIFTKIEEVAEIELLESVLYSYRLSGSRTSHQLGTAAAEDMWRRLAVQTLERRGLPLECINDKQPFVYSPTPPPEARRDDLCLLVDVGGDEPANESAEDRRQWSAKTGIAPQAVRLQTRSAFATPRLDETLRQSGQNYVCVIRGEPVADCQQVIDLLMEALETHEADLVAPQIVDGDDQLLLADPYFDSRLMPTIAGQGEPAEGRYREVSSVSWLPANLLVMRRCVFHTIGGFDPDLPGVLGDSDFCLRARSRGFQCVYAGTIQAVSNRWCDEEFSDAHKRRFLARWSRLPELMFPEEQLQR